MRDYMRGTTRRNVPVLAEYNNLKDEGPLLA